jgi:hypothetical protein
MITLKTPQKGRVSMGDSNFNIILLTRGKVALVDQEDYDFLMQWKWTLHSEGYAYRNNREGDRFPRIIMMHRIINHTPKGMVTDHINRNRLDNRKVNLRSATKRENSLNTERNKNNTSGHRGIVKSQHNGWTAQTTYNYKNIYIGSYPTKDEAIAAYNAALLMIEIITN